MPVRPHVRGGEKLKRFVARAETATTEAVKTVEVGFFADARYPPVYTGRGPRAGQKQNPEPVTNVAVWNEFGTTGGASGGGWGGPIPQRPFFRQALNGAKKELHPILRQHIDPKTMVVTRRVGGLLGSALQGRVQKSITAMNTPSNADATITLKGSSNPLLDTGFLRQAVTYRIDGAET